MRKKLFVVVMFLVVGLGTGFAQQGFLKGKITDKSTGEELVGTAVVVDGTTTGTITDFTGEYMMPALDPGSYTIRVQYISYNPMVFNNVVVKAGEETVLNIQLSSATMDIEEVSVVAKANRESENMLLMEQKNAVVAFESIGAEQLSSQGVSDASGAVTKLSGIVKQEGSQSLNVRGLGDRYNTTTYNGLPLPSNNAELKNINLELFSTDVISHINIEKTYSANLYGDFGGANIDIISKKLTGDSFLSLSVKGSQNSSLFDLDDFYLGDGPNKSGFYKLDVPNVDDIKDVKSYGFKNSWNPVKSNVVPSIGLGLSGGRSFIVGDVSKLNAFFTFSFDNDRAYTERIERVVNAGGNAWDDLRGEEYAYATQSSGMLNLNYNRPNTDIYFNSLLLNSSEQDFTTLVGNIRDVNDKKSGMKRRSDFERNFVLVNQLLGNHKLSESVKLDWGVTYNYVWNNVPDRMENTYLFYYPESNTGELDTEAVGRNYRYIHEFDDNEAAANLSLEKTFGEGINDTEYRGKLTFGYAGRYKLRNFTNFQFNHQINVGNQVIVDVDNVDSFFNEDNFLDKQFLIGTPTAGDENGEQKYGEGYEGKVSINAGFVNFEYNISEKLLLLVGLRGESVFQEMNTRSRQNFSGRVETIDFNEFKILPSLSFKYAASEKSNVRLAASRTYTLPQLQEMPFIAFSGITDVTYGNPHLVPSTIYNVDIKFEIFPKREEMLSATIFGKLISDPINKIALASTFNEFTNANTGESAHVFGIEIDGKKDLFDFSTGEKVKKIYTAGNLTLMQSQTDLDAKRIVEDTERKFNTNFNKKTSDLQGSAPVLANLTIGFKQKWDENKKSITSAVVYNYTSDRLYSIGHTNMGDQVDQAISTLDLIVKTQFNKIGVDVSAKNILNPNYQRVQENTDQDYIVRQYKKGANFSISLKYNF